MSAAGRRARPGRPRGGAGLIVVSLSLVWGATLTAIMFSTYRQATAGANWRAERPLIVLDHQARRLADAADDDAVAAYLPEAAEVLDDAGLLADLELFDIDTTRGSAVAVVGDVCNRLAVGTRSTPGVVFGCRPDDTAAPHIEEPAPLAGSGTVPVTVVVGDDRQTATVELALGDDPPVGAVRDGWSNRWSADLDTTGHPAGPVDLHVRATDAAAHLTEASFTFTVTGP